MCVYIYINFRNEIEVNLMLFLQEKYRLKKQKKYAPKVLMRRPVARR